MNIYWIYIDGDFIPTKAIYYDVTDGYLDLYDEEENCIETFAPGFWKAIRKIDDQH